MSKFKVGDKVVGNMSASKRYTITKEGYAGTVTGVFSSGSIMLNNSYLVNEQCFDLASPANHSIHITCTDNKTTHAVKKVDGKVVARSTAVCCPSDTFDFAVGAQLAFNRLVHGADHHPADVAMRPKQPKQEPVKLYCVKDYRPGTWVTKGKVYEVDTTGGVKMDDGYVTEYSSAPLSGKPFTEYFVPLVSRPAEVGEWVLITADSVDGTEKGEICEVLSLNECGSNRPYLRTKKPTIYGTPEVKPCTLANHNQYLVLDGYKPEPEYLNMKVICVDAGVGRWFTTGKVYEVRNGVLNDNGGKFDYNPHSPAKTLEQLNVEHVPKFIEFKGE
jgi:hypothetical protein